MLPTCSCFAHGLDFLTGAWLITWCVSAKLYHIRPWGGACRMHGVEKRKAKAISISLFAPSHYQSGGCSHFVCLLATRCVAPRCTWPAGLTPCWASSLSQLSSHLSAWQDQGGCTPLAPVLLAAPQTTARSEGGPAGGQGGNGPPLTCTWDGASERSQNASWEHTGIDCANLFPFSKKLKCT